MDPKRLVADGYDAIGDAYAAQAVEWRTLDREWYLDTLSERLPQGASLLDLGCGAGIPTTGRLAERFDVTGVDISHQQIVRARRNVLDARFVEGDMTEVEFAPDSLDAVTAFYSIIHFAVSRYVTGLNPWYGAALAVAPVIIVFAVGGPLGRVASVAFVGVSLLLQAIRGDGGCEVMAMPSMLFGRRTHLVCIFFSPIDWVEKHLTGPGGLPG